MFLKIVAFLCAFIAPFAASSSLSAQERLQPLKFPTMGADQSIGDRTFAEAMTERLSPQLAILEWLRVAHSGFPSEATAAKLEALRLAAQHGFQSLAEDLAAELTSKLETDPRLAEVLFWQSRIASDPQPYLSQLHTQFGQSEWTETAQNSLWWDQAELKGYVADTSSSPWLNQLKQRLSTLKTLAPPQWLIWLPGGPNLWQGGWILFTLKILLSATLVSMLLYAVSQRHIPYASGIAIFGALLGWQTYIAQLNQYQQLVLQDRLAIMATWDGLKPQLPQPIQE